MKEEKYWILLSKKIAGEASPEELELLGHLISGNQEWQTIMENLQELWNSKPVTVKARQYQKNEDAYLVHINRLKEKVADFKETGIPAEHMAEPAPVAVKKPFYKRWVTYVAVAAAVTAVVFLVNPDVANNPQRSDIASASPINEITINPGSRSKILLPDGSQVWINSGTKLTYHTTFSGSTRDVQLDGEAYFDVVHDAAHPFIVHTSGIDIRVLGTVFNVKAYTADPFIEATLINGSIEVINKNRPGTPKVMLKPHEKLVYNKFPVADPRDQRADIVVSTEPDAYSITIKPLTKNIADSDIVETAWVFNKLTFEDERFEDLAHRMERWYNVKISIGSDKLKNHRVSGSFIDETAEEAIRELQFLIPFRYSIKNSEILIMKK